MYQVVDNVNARIIEDIRGWDAMHGTLLVAELAAFAILLDKLSDFKWWSVTAMAVAFVFTAWCLWRKPLWGSVREIEDVPEPAAFMEIFPDDPPETRDSVIDDLVSAAEENRGVRQRKRNAFRTGVVALFLAVLVATGTKVLAVYSPWGGSEHEENQHIGVCGGETRATHSGVGKGAISGRR